MHQLCRYYHLYYCLYLSIVVICGGHLHLLDCAHLTPCHSQPMQFTPFNTMVTIVTHILFFMVVRLHHWHLCRRHLNYPIKPLANVIVIHILFIALEVIGSSLVGNAILYHHQYGHRHHHLPRNSPKATHSYCRYYSWVNYTANLILHFSSIKGDYVGPCHSFTRITKKAIVMIIFTFHSHSHLPIKMIFVNFIKDILVLNFKIYCYTCIYTK